MVCFVAVIAQNLNFIVLCSYFTAGISRMVDITLRVVVIEGQYIPICCAINSVLCPCLGCYCCYCSNQKEN